VIGYAVSAVVDGYAYLDRATERQKLVEAAEQRVGYHRRLGRERPLVTVETAQQMRRELSKLTDGSCVVLVDCALEHCWDEADLLACWAQVRRVSGATEQSAPDVFVVRVQKWAQMRQLLDPRLRWVIKSAPPGSSKLEYEPFSRRSSVLADVRLAGRAKKNAKRSP
jgi:hypothetical protein